MIPPTPGADPASRLFGSATPPDGAGPIGENGAWPQPSTATFDEVVRGLNPIHYIPVVGMIYRVVTGETIPPAMKVLGAGLTGGPLGMLGSAFLGLAEEIIRMGPDLSRPSMPVGMSQASEHPMDPVTPGTAPAGSYTTLATTMPEFLQQPTMFAGDAGRAAAAYQMASREWSTSQAVEKGLA